MNWYTLETVLIELASWIVLALIASYTIHKRPWGWLRKFFYSIFAGFVLLQAAIILSGMFGPLIRRIAYNIW